MDKRFWGILAVIVVLFGIIFYATNSHNSSSSSGSASLTNHTEGKGTTGVQLTEYGDYECPACGQYYPLVKQVVASYGDQIVLQFRNFPLYQIHENAMSSARAAEAAALQGKFWQMHDMLYENQQEWSHSNNAQGIFDGYAKQLGLNVTKFDSDFKSTAVNDRIQKDLAEGNRLKIDSTPTFFLGNIGDKNPTKITNPTSLDAFKKVIDDAIKKKTGKAPAAQAPTSTQPSGTQPTTDQSGASSTPAATPAPASGSGQ